MNLVVKLGIAGALLFVGCVGGVGWLVYRAVSAKVNPSTDYAGQIEALSVQSQSDRASEPDRWPELMSIVGRAAEVHKEVLSKYAVGTGSDRVLEVIDPSVLRGGEIPAGQQRVIPASEELLQKLAAASVFKDLSALHANGRFVRPRQKGTPLFGMDQIVLGQIRQLTRYGAAQMRMANRAGDETAYVEAFSGACGLGRALMHQASMFDRLTGDAILTMAMQELHQGNAERPLSANVLRQCAKILDDQTLIGSVRETLEGERCSVKDVIQWTFTDTGDGDGWLMPAAAGNLDLKGAPAVTTGSAENIMGLLQSGRKETTRVIDEHFDNLQTYAAASRAARLSLPFQPDDVIEHLSKRNLVLMILLPALGNVIEADDRVNMQMAGTRTILAIEVFMRDHNQEPPATLSELGPVYIATVPIDVISGKAFGYRVFKPGEDAFGRRYLLYSIGSDGIDNGGKQAAKVSDRHDALKLSGKGGQGLDFVINDPEVWAKKNAASGEPGPSK